MSLRYAGTRPPPRCGGLTQPSGFSGDDIIANRSPRILAVFAVFFGLFFFAAGAFCYLSVFGLVAGTPPRSAGDVAFIAIVGSVFTTAGLSIMAFGLGKRSAGGKIGAASLLAFVLAFNWIAFAPGERSFVRKTSSSFTAPQKTDVSESEGRFVFGAGALLMDLIIICGFVASRRPKA